MGIVTNVLTIFNIRAYLKQRVCTLCIIHLDGPRSPKYTHRRSSYDVVKAGVANYNLSYLLYGLKSTIASIGLVHIFDQYIMQI